MCRQGAEAARRHGKAALGERGIMMTFPILIQLGQACLSISCLNERYKRLQIANSQIFSILRSSSAAGILGHGGIE
jgi:hypothetical protein